MPRSPAHWLVKTEPDCFSIHDLADCPRQTTCWSGVRNYQARNFLRDGMKLGDQVFFYHSNAAPPAIVGLAIVAREAYPDATAWEPDDDHYDPKASPENPIWQMVDLQLQEIFPRPLGLDELRNVPALKNMELLRKGSRLSVQPVKPAEFAAVMRLVGSQTSSRQDSKVAKKPSVARRPSAAKP